MREEMAQKLSDVVFRRTDLGTAAMPGEDALTSCANLMAAEKGWKQERIKAELAEVRKVYPPFNKKY
jgi:glycerol-3-phosphate dehydrogenase